jgi:L-ribulose-5-phosphate 3-epimerase
MIKLGCNAMLRVAEKLPQADKDDSSNWIDIEELVHFIHRLRLDIIDFQLFRGFRSKDPDYLRRVKILCQQCGLPIGFLGIGPGFVGTQVCADGTVVGAALDPDELRRRIALVQEGIDLAAFMGAPLIRHFGGAIPQESQNRDVLWQTVVRSFQEVSDYAADKGVLIGLHNHAPATAPTGEDILRLLHDVDRENFTYILDTGQWQGSPGSSSTGVRDAAVDFYEFIEQTAPHATYVRAKIYKIDSGQEEWIDYERVMEILRKVDFNGNMSIVFEGRNNQCSDFEAIGLAVKFLRRLLAQ